MSNKKDYKIKNNNLIPVDFSKSNNNDNLIFTTCKGKVDFNRWNYLDRPKSDVLTTALYLNREQLILDVFNAINQLSHELADQTVEALASSGCIQLFEFLDYKYKQGEAIFSISQISRTTIDELLIWLKNKPANTKTGRYSTLGVRKHYSTIKTILTWFVHKNKLSSEIFPYAPFVNVNRSGIGTEAYSKSEFSKLMRFLWSQINLIRNDDFKGPLNQKLSIYALVIAAKTGRNTSSIINMSIDCIQPHPLAADTHILLTTFKKRGMNTSVQAMRNSYELQDVYSSHKDVAGLIQEVSDLTKTFRLKEKNLFLTIKKDNRTVCALTEPLFFKSVQAICLKASIIDDHGKLLKFQVKRMRKTFGNRIWKLTGGDPIKTAKIMGNTTPILNTHYLDVTPEMEKNHKYLGHIISESLLGNNKSDSFIKHMTESLNIDSDSLNKLLIGDFNTGVGRCSDPFTGKYSPKNNSACSRFLTCFKCPNQVVLESDLHRLFSFYWLLVKESGFIGKSKWKKTYSWVIKVIDSEITPVFSKELLDKAKESAKITPHPMWSNRLDLKVI